MLSLFNACLKEQFVNLYYVFYFLLTAWAITCHCFSSVAQEIRILEKEKKTNFIP